MVGLVIVVLSTLLSSLTGIAVLVKNSKQRANILYGLTSISYILLGVANFLSIRSEDGEKLVYARLVMVFTTVAVALTFYLVRMLLGVSGEVGRRRKKFVALKLPGVLFTSIVVGLSMTPLIISGVEGVVPSFGPGMAIFICHMMLFSVGIIGTLLRTLVRSDDEQMRDQAKYLLIGFLPVLLVAPLTGIYLPAVQQDLRFIVLTPVYSAFFVIMVGYAMMRHQLFGIRFYVVRLMTFTFSQLLIGLIYIAPLIFLALTIARVDVSWQKFILLTILFTVVATYYGRVRRWFRKVTNRIFLQDLYDPPELLAEVNKRLVSVVDLDKMLKDMNALLKEYIRPEFSFFVLRGGDSKNYRIFGDKSSPTDVVAVLHQADRISSNVVLGSMLDQDSTLYKSMAKDDIAVLVRIPIYDESDKEVVAYIVFGSKKSGSTYNPEDMQTLNTVANGLVIALQNAFRFEEIKGFNLTLQQKVDDATKKLRKTNERLRLLDQTKDDFISMASHQLRTPLTSVKGYVSMVLDGDGGKVNETQRKLLTQSFLSSQRMVYLISDLLNVSRLKTGKFVIEPVESNLAEVIEEELSQLTETVKSKGLELKYHKPEHFPTLMFDETKIRQVIMNFVDNAIYYTPTGGHIEVKLVDKPDSIDFTVADDGIGVPKHEQHHLFSKFYRAKNAQTARPDGTGLGIFMAKKVIIAQGGAVIFSSAEGKGSTFGFTFPKSKLVAKTPSKSAEKQPA